MDSVIQFLLEMDASTFSQYVNYFYLALAAVAIIGFIVGCIKGLYKESTTFVVTAAYLIVVVCLTGTISRFIYDADISGLIKEFKIEGVPEGITSVGQYLENYLIEFCESKGIEIGNSVQLMDSITSIAMTIINLAVYLVLLILGIVLIFIVDMLVYFLIVRFLVSKETRRNKKVRPLGGLIGAVRYLVAFCLLLTPFTGLVNSIVSELRDENGEIQRSELDDDYYNAIMNVLEGYNNSSLGQFFFSLTDENGKPFDVTLMDYITHSTINEEEIINLYDEVGNIGALAVKAYGTGAIDLVNGVNYSLLLGADFVTEALETVSKSTLLKTLLTVGATIAVNMDAVKDKVDLSSIDFFEVDWSDSLSAVSSAYSELYNAGIVDSVIENPDQFLNEFYLDGEHSTSVKNALRTIGDDDLVSKIMPHLIVSYLKTLVETPQQQGRLSLRRTQSSSGFEALLDVNIFEDIKWGTELVNIYNVFENISKQYYAYENTHLTLGSIDKLQPSDILSTCFGVGIDFSSEEDTSYSDKYENNVFINGGTFLNEEVEHNLPGLKNILGLNNTEESNGLFDLQIMDIAIDYDLIEEVDVDGMINIEGVELDLNSKISEIVTNWEKQQWKNELSGVIDVVVPVLDLVQIINDSTKDETPDIEEAKRAVSSEETVLKIDLKTILGDDSLNCLKRVTDVLKNSSIFNEILPDVLQAYVDTQEEEFVPGLSISDMNFTYFENDETMISELRKFIDGVDSFNEDLVQLISKLNIDNVVNDCASGSSSVLSQLLKLFESNKIINKDLTTEEIDNGEHKTFTRIMANVLGKTDNAELEMNLYNMSQGKVIIEPELIYSFDNTSIWDEEIDGLVGFIGSLKGDNGKDQIILDYVSGKLGNDFNLTDEIFKCGNEIERIFTSVDDSVILKEAFPSTVDSLLGSQFDELLGTGPKFSNIESWALEGHYFNQLLTNINLIKGNNDISNIDWLSADSSVLSELAFESRPNEFKELYDYSYEKYFVENSRVNKLLTSLYDAQCIGGSYSATSRENGVFHIMLKNILSTALEKLDIKIEGDDVLQENLISSDFDIDNSDKVLYTINNSQDIYVSWKGDTENDYYGEIGNISILVNSLSGFDMNQSFEEIDVILEKVNECHILRNALPLIIDSKTQDLKVENGNETDELINEFIDRSDFSVFHKEDLSMTPYEINDNQLNEINNSNITCRLDEIHARNIEIHNIIDVVNEVKDVADKITQTNSVGDKFAPLKSALENKTVKNELSKDVSDIENILTKLHNSKVFHAVKSFTNNGERSKLTAFEYFYQYALDSEAVRTGEDKNNDGDIDKLFVIPSNKMIYEITSNDGWLSTQEKVGEITKFNNGLYNFLENPLVDISLNGTDNFIEDVQKELIVDGVKKTPIQDLLLSLDSSELLRISTAKVLDEHILFQVLKALDYDYYDDSNNEFVSNKTIYQDEINTLDLQYDNLTEFKEALHMKGWSNDKLNELTSLNDVKKYIWINEGQSIEDLIRSLNEIEFGSLNIKDITGEFVEEITSAMRNSFGLNYLEVNSPNYSSLSNPERSVYHLAIIKVTNTTVSTIEEALGLNKGDTLTTSYKIKDYDKEAQVIVKLVNEYNRKYIKPGTTDQYYSVSDILSNDSFVGTESIFIEKYSAYNDTTNDDLDKINQVVQILKTSDVYNYSREEASSERNIYQRVIMKMVDAIKTGFVTSGIISQNESDDTKLEYIKLGEFENVKQTSFDIARKYKEVENLLDDNNTNGSIVEDLNDSAREKVENLIGELQDSSIYNYTLHDDGVGYITGEDRSIYQHIIIFMLDKFNESFVTELQLDTSNSKEDKIRDYKKEMDTILDVIQAYQKVNAWFSGYNDINFDGMTNAQKQAFIDDTENVLLPLYNSDVYHYVNSSYGFARPSKNGTNQLSNLTIFEQLIYTMVHSSNHITEHLYLEGSFIAYSESLTNSSEVINLRIREISTSDKEDGELTWWDENLMVGEITKLHDVIGQDMTSDLNVEELHLSNLIRDIEDVNDSDKLLNKVNNSYILHDVVPNVISKFVSTHSAEEGVVNPDEQSIVVSDLIFLKGTPENSYYDYSSYRGYCGEEVDSYKIDENTSYSFDEKVQHWNNDLYHIAKIVDLLNELKNAENDIMRLNNMNFFEYFLYHLSSTETYHEMVPQILITILNDKLSVNISGVGKYSLGSLIAPRVGDDIIKLNSFYSLIDNYTIYNDEFTYDSNLIKVYNVSIYQNEGKGLDQFVSSYRSGSLNVTTGALATNMATNIQNPMYFF